ncbi:MAG: prephenate dehydrogenase/arogenate dehydrogenase family protein [Opitutales bacterium]|nr:prephenate dehydrogenase/arogenate dehydrogenase family protein [Opitutales bacterium]
MFKQITIIAPGLLGASLGAAAQARQLADRIVVWARREETREQCRHLAWCDAVYAEVEAAASEAEIVVICAPVEAIPPLARAAAAAMVSGGLITDVGSTKAEICRELVGTLPDGVEFVGSHPMAGSEKSGLEHADPDLFNGRCCLVTPAEGNSESAQRRTEAFWRAVGMDVHALEPTEHDQVVAELSHLPHVAASVLAAYLGRNPDSWRAFAGAGLRDTTRIAAGSVPMWMDILHQNRSAILQSLDGFKKELNAFTKALEAEDETRLREVLESGKSFRRSLDD